MRLLLGTNNKGKAIEMAEALSDLPIDVVTPEELGIHEKPEETGTTYMENAILKARFFHTLSGGLPTVGDDSGFIVEALTGELGIHTRRWGAGPDATDKEWIDFFLNRMANETNRRASCVCALAYIDAQGIVHGFEGKSDGTLTTELECETLPGLPFSGVFRIDGWDRVFGAMPLADKNRVSHRGKALIPFQQHLKQSLQV